jgi:hypothetical protein
MNRQTLHKAILTSFLLTIFYSFTYAQDKTAHDLRFLKAKITDTTDKKDVIVLFHVSAKDEKDYPPVLSMRLTYSVNDETEKTRSEIRKDKNIHIVIFGKNIKEQNKAIYNLIKDKIDTSGKQDFMILGFYLNDISSDKVKKMTFTYGLWEKQNQDIRVEKKYEFEVEQ